MRNFTHILIICVTLKYAAAKHTLTTILVSSVSRKISVMVLFLD